MLMAYVGEPRVLVVDDERIIADSLAMILSRNGFAARPAYSGEEAVRVAEDWHPDVLISDVTMDSMNGFDTARAVLMLLPQCSVILISGHRTFEMFDRLGEEFEVLQKPVSPKTLLSKLKDLRKFKG